LFKARGNTDDAEDKRLIDISFEADINLFDTQMASPTGSIAGNPDTIV